MMGAKSLMRSTGGTKASKSTGSTSLIFYTRRAIPQDSVNGSLMVPPISVTIV